MIENGLVGEVRSLVERGYHFQLPSMKTVGYEQIGRYLQGELSLPEAVQQIKYDTHRLAIHQYAWFRLSDPRIRWLDIEDQALDEKAHAVVKGAIHA